MPHFHSIFVLSQVNQIRSKSIFMKTFKLLCGIAVSTCLFWSCNDSSNSLLPEPSPEVTTRAAGSSEVLLQWNTEKQTIDGFGVAQAGWTDYLYAHRKRNEVMNLLFGNDGLHLNILRGEVYPHYWENETDKDFNMNEDIDMSLDDPFFDIDFSADGNEAAEAIAQRKGQLWITKQAKETYNVNKLVFSTWSAPAYMKDNGSTSNGHLSTSYYQAYADYLSAFCNAYKSAGLNPYAISPANEPEYAASWNSCLWSYKQLGTFLVNNLIPTFSEQQPDVKIIFGENAQWNKVWYVYQGSKTFTNNVLNNYPAVAKYPVIAAGHGYPNPKIPGLPLPDDVMPTIEPFDKAEANNIPVWLTEISDAVQSYTTSMSDGLKWAKLFHKYLSDANVAAIIWWAGALPDHGTNEGLIYIAKDRVSYETSKRYEVFGNFTRYIPAGSKRVTIEKGGSVNSNILISGYKNNKEFTAVAINPTSNAATFNLGLSGATISGNLKAYVTDETRKWVAQEDIVPVNGVYTVNLPANSVVTFTGTAE